MIALIGFVIGPCAPRAMLKLGSKTIYIAGATSRPRYNFQTVNFSYSQSEIAELISEFTDPQVREAVELAALPEILKNCSYFIDVGANVGQYTFHAAKHLRNSKLIAIEANPFLINTKFAPLQFRTCPAPWSFM